MSSITVIVPSSRKFSNSENNPFLLLIPNELLLNSPIYSAKSQPSLLILGSSVILSVSAV